MSEALYTSLRDDTAGKLIAQFGRTAALRHATAQNYDPATGDNAPTVQEVTVRVVEIGLSALLRGAGGKNRFSEDLVEQWDSGIIMSAKETSAAGVEPGVDDVLVIGGKSARIKWIEPVAPSGIPVIYKMAVARM